MGKRTSLESPRVSVFWHLEGRLAKKWMEKGREIEAEEDFSLLLYICNTSPTSLEKMVGKVQYALT